MTKAGQRTDYMTPDEERISELEDERDELLRAIRAEHEYKANNVPEAECVCNGAVMIKHPFVLVGFEPDWEALYVNGKKVCEGHHVNPSALVDWTRKYMLTVGSDPNFELRDTHVAENEGNEYGEHEIPARLEELPPWALERISA